ncbi:alpha-ketoglutarate-dependent dioxygenase alkB homolog 3-like [Anneissia japonica]|uniref:alpha-ketoglutarate-dependent dioxygenase alkB homolog 3-like n=1 Tax=Anneissia japonica TaxID=1529436 RepID=UPI0014257D93|nr:alpha-ketoglutarate-dependent dioxygenase alkB homolog 3-like [Anneissia japonica]XP_033101941.1 alpha-ketoglutarate-dependent dioxygenase alkB homolog 3-like [Anneissia japonica]XP_033101942.1 alpha-ketoglutarate-dependent dioxygenase alkB homolog 3-like [Anneissia japonica]XP_033101943.1 alpha-ketoglutarate-dependent dioxygenase alkB homolog 3-like [Anneissia japonica]
MSNPRQRKQRLQGGAFGRGAARPGAKPRGLPDPEPESLVNNENGSISRFAGQQMGVAGGQSLTYEDPNIDRRAPTEYELIEDKGTYVISEKPSGPAIIELYPDFLSEDEALGIFNSLCSALPWSQKINKKDDFTFMEPRLTVWYGDIRYKYSGVTQEATKSWHPVLEDLRERITKKTGLKFNSMLGNLYRDGHDSVAWHSDNEYSLGTNPTIASLSFGETRAFQLRKNPENFEDTYEFTDKKQINLTNGCLLLMKGAVQEDWQHRVPKEYHDRRMRINLTFRTIYSE